MRALFTALLAVFALMFSSLGFAQSLIGPTGPGDVVQQQDTGGSGWGSDKDDKDEDEDEDEEDEEDEEKDDQYH